MLKSNRRVFLDKASASGFTLLEVLIALSILAITLTVVYGSQSQSLSLAAESRFNNRAAFLMQSKLAELESGEVELYNAEGDFGDEYPGYNWQIEIEDVELTDLVDVEAQNMSFKRVMLTISWAESPFTHSINYFLRAREEF